MEGVQRGLAAAGQASLLRRQIALELRILHECALTACCLMPADSNQLLDQEVEPRAKPIVIVEVPIIGWGVMSLIIL